jgi:hypothetical protein
MDDDFSELMDAMGTNEAQNGLDDGLRVLDIGEEEIDRLMMARDDLMNGSPSNVADLAVGQAETPHQIWSMFSEEQKGLANRILKKLLCCHPKFLQSSQVSAALLSPPSDLLDSEYEFMLKHKAFWAGDMSDLSGTESELQKLGYFTIEIRSTATNGQIAKGECRIFFVDIKLKPKTGAVPDGVKLKFAVPEGPASTTYYEPDEPVGILRRPVNMVGQDRVKGPRGRTPEAALVLGDSLAVHLVSRVTEAEAEDELPVGIVSYAPYSPPFGRREYHRAVDTYSIFHSYKTSDKSAQPTSWSSSGMDSAEKKSEVELLEEAGNGDAEAQSTLGLMYFQGDGVAQDTQKGLGLLEKAAGQEHADAQCALGLFYLHGQDVVQDTQKGKGLMEMAAEQGCAEAQYALGMMYLRGDCVAQDKPKGKALLEKAAEKGDAEAQFELSNMYLKGDGLAQDMEKGMELLNKAADHGHAGTPHTTHHTPYSTHHTPACRCSTPHTIQHTPYSTHHTPYAIRHTPYTIHHTNHGIHCRSTQCTRQFTRVPDAGADTRSSDWQY